jgi:uncharacterized membrane protein HdeD (DUF308 family)
MRGPALSGEITLRHRDLTQKEPHMIALGLILLILGLVLGQSLLTTIGAILLVVGLVLNLVPVGGTRRRVY